MEFAVRRFPGDSAEFYSENGRLQLARDMTHSKRRIIGEKCFNSAPLCFHYSIPSGNILVGALRVPNQLGKKQERAVGTHECVCLTWNWAVKLGRCEVTCDW